MKCRFCEKELHFKFIDLGSSPPSNSILTHEELNEPEVFFPLKLYVCDNCFLVQIDEYKKSNEIFNEKYAYFSSFSKSWLTHSKNYVSMVINKFNLDNNSLVIEIACNDGYLLQYFKEQDIPCLGIEPSSNTAQNAKQKGIEVIEDYFGTQLANNLIKRKKKPDLIIGNNVLAHVPNINDFVKGLKVLLNQNGIITMEFPHIMKLIQSNQFDTIYHEHFSYFSFYTVNLIFNHHGLEIFDVDEINTHGGSIRIYAHHKDSRKNTVSKNVNNLLKSEKSIKINNLEYYMGFQDRINKVKNDLLQFLINKKNEGNKIIAYGAAAKGNTLLNYCGIKEDLITFVVDLSPFKQGKYLPGSHIPIVKENKIKTYKPDYILILPWNIKDEIIDQLDYVKNWNAKFFIAIPEVKQI
ncbi:MAG: class I SAM-dependent methyltransferase [Candidatus Lokiarchaeota archaeon]|nr:class I SAM-dependent methyltransferase [Candidatus Lokiarchaeota archaeon]